MFGTEGLLVDLGRGWTYYNMVVVVICSRRIRRGLYYDITVNVNNILVQFNNYYNTPTKRSVQLTVFA